MKTFYVLFQPVLLLASFASVFTLSAADLLVAEQAAYAKAVKQAKSVANINFKDGVWRDVKIVLSSNGIDMTPVTLKRAKNGLLYPTDKAQAKFGAPAGLTPVSTDATGPAWYAKPAADTPFDSGKTIQVAASDNAPSFTLGALLCPLALAAIWLAGNITQENRKY